jgi:hypothetical protein
MIVRFAKQIVVLSVVVLAVAFLPAVVLAQGDAAAAIASAKQQLVVCYGAARQAESAGANVSYLVSMLSEAGDLLSRSELAYSQGDLSGAQDLASQCSQKLSNFAAAADSLKAGATGNEDWFHVEAVASVIGVVLVVISGFLVWRSIRKQYVPVEVESEAETDESS